MNLLVVGCSHHNAPIETRERLAFSDDQARAALEQFASRFAGVEAVLLSTCNRVELYTATESGDAPSMDQLAAFLAGFHGRGAEEFLPYLYYHVDCDAARHLFTVASSLDSMVLGEPQILAQVKQAYQLAAERENVGPLLHAAFQAALRVARRVAGETGVHRHRVSIPSVAVADFAEQIFERFDDKKTLVIGAGDMAEETLQYLRDAGARDVTVVNRSPDRAKELAGRWRGKVLPWERLGEGLAAADLVISATGAAAPIVTVEQFAAVASVRGGRPLFVLDLAVPRDFEPSVGARPDVYLYSVDDLREACRRNRRERDKELPAAERIIVEETDRFIADLRHRASGPVIQQIREQWRKPKEEELERLWNKLPNLDESARDEIRQSFDRLVNKLLHPPLESLRDESRHGIPSAMLDAITKLFRLHD